MSNGISKNYFLPIRNKKQILEVFKRQLKVITILNTSSLSSSSTTPYQRSLVKQSSSNCQYFSKKRLCPSTISLKSWYSNSKLWSYSLSLLITGRSPPQVCKYSALKPSNENKRVGGVSNLGNRKKEHV